GMEQFFPQEYVPGAVVSNAIYSGNSGTSAFFRLGTLLDSDGDGLTDAHEIFSLLTDPYNPDTDGDGLSDGFEYLNNMDPLHNDAPDPQESDDLKTWQMINTQSCSYTDTGIIYKRTFEINRSLGWQQYFITLEPTNTAFNGVGKLCVEWSTPDGESGADWFRHGMHLPITNAAPTHLTITLHAFDPFMMPHNTSFNFVEWAPQLMIADAITAVEADGSIKHAVVGENDLFVTAVEFDFSTFPGTEPIPVAQRAALANLFPTDQRLVFTPQEGGKGIVTANAPFPFELTYPTYSSAAPSGGTTTMAMPAGAGTVPEGDWLLFLSPHITYGEGHCGGTGVRLDFDALSATYTPVYEYPLDSQCLRYNWLRDVTGGYTCNCEPAITYGNEALRPFFTEHFSIVGNTATGTIRLGGKFVWQGEAIHYTDCSREEEGVQLLSSDECDDYYSGCADENCDHLEGDSLGSLRFRIPLGMPRNSQISGFLWFETDAPLLITPSIPNLLPHPDATIADNTSGGVRTITCSDNRGRTAIIEPIAGGIRITMQKTLDDSLEHTWEITNGNASGEIINFRKISRQNNIMRDVSYIRKNEGWLAVDNIGQLSEEIISRNGLDDPGDGVLHEEHIIRSLTGTVLSHTITESRRFGDFDNAI
ncbi:MAG: hypothetical protein GX804_06755, partial [Lentisphaerae bacterium]|nr:hypothetical protein [Lentisphaerota bacterium]